MANKIYQTEIVKELRLYYHDVLFQLDKFETIASHLTAIAARMWEGIQHNIIPVFHELNNYHPDFLGKSPDVLAEMDLSLEDCQKCISAEYGYSSWENLLELGYQSYNTTFENCVNVLMDGDLVTLEKFLDIDSSLTSQQSQYGHKATLVHYAAANGVEMWRQQTPYNLPELVKVLLDHGADPNATMMVYNKEHTPLELLTTSAHPREAGVVEAVRKLLVIGE
jgi:hypothetical protein